MNEEPTKGRPKTFKQKMVTSSIQLPAEAWAMIDAERGESSRSSWILKKLTTKAQREAWK